MLAERVCLPGAVDADDEREPPGTPRDDAGERILEDGGATGFNAERPCRGQEAVGRWLASQVLARDRDPVDPCLDQVGEAGRVEHLAGVLA